jgi:hypothetical protein
MKFNKYHVIISALILMAFTIPAINTYIGSPNTTVESKGGFKVDSGGIELPVWDSTKKYTGKGLSITNGVLAFNSADNTPMYLKSGVWTSFASAGAGMVTSVSSSSLAPIFTTTVTNPTTTPAITYSLTAAAQQSFLGNKTSSSAAPTYFQLSGFPSATTFFRGDYTWAPIFKVDTFSATGDGSTLTFTQTVDAGYTKVIGSLTTCAGNPGGVDLATFKISISGTTVTVTFYSTTTTVVPPTGAFTITMLLIP